MGTATLRRRVDGLRTELEGLVQQERQRRRGPFLYELFRMEEPRPVPEFPPEPAPDAPDVEVLAWVSEVARLLWWWEHGTAPKPLSHGELLKDVREHCPEREAEVLALLDAERPRLHVVPEPEVDWRERDSGTWTPEQMAKWAREQREAPETGQEKLNALRAAVRTGRRVVRGV
jgi:hypothetical protein